jgi:hypothetical protein
MQDILGRREGGNLVGWGEGTHRCLERIEEYEEMRVGENVLHVVAGEIPGRDVGMGLGVERSVSNVLGGRLKGTVA